MKSALLMFIFLIAVSANAGPFGFSAERVEQIEANAWHVDRPFYVLEGSKYWIYFSLSVGDYTDPSVLDDSICRSLGFTTAREDSRVRATHADLAASSPSKQFSYVTLNSQGAIIGLTKHSTLMPLGLFWKELICEKLD